jgi:enoyl-CoA hydratase
MSYTTLLTELSDRILTITINRPEKLNALNKQVIEDLSAVMDDVYQNAAIGAVIITGSGLKSFVAGADIAEFMQLNASQGSELAAKGQSMVFDKIENCPKPVFAAVNGFALGGGCELAMSCHVRYASETAKFGQPEVNLGLIPGYGGTQRLTQLVGKGRAMELLMSAQMISAAEALQYGLVNKVVAPEELIAACRATLQVILTKAPLAVAACIKSVNAVWNEQQNGYQVEIAEFGKCFDTKDMQEGVTAFLEKRKAVFTGQ